MIKTISRNASVLAVLGAFTTAFPAIETRQQMQLQREGVELIRQLEEVSRDISYHAARLKSFAGSAQISRWTHYHHLEMIRTLVNDGLQPALVRLTDIQPQLPEWKRDSIDSMLNAARAVAMNANAAIQSKNEDPVRPAFLNSEYRSLLERMFEHAEELVRTSDAAASYAAARMKAAEAGLNVPTN